MTRLLLALLLCACAVKQPRLCGWMQIHYPAGWIDKHGNRYAGPTGPMLVCVWIDGDTLLDTLEQMSFEIDENGDVAWRSAWDMDSATARWRKKYGR